MPAEYKNASTDFDGFLLDVSDTCMLQTHHQAYHTLRAVTKTSTRSPSLRLHDFKALLEAQKPRL